MTSAASAMSRKSRLSYQGLLQGLFAVFVFSGMMVLFEPAPYDLLALIVITLWAINGFSVHRSQLLILGLWCVLAIAGFFALLPYWDEPDPRIYQFLSLYLFITGAFFTLFFAQRTEQRAMICLYAYAAGTVIAATVGIISYLNIGGLGAALTVEEGRVSGTFKDPNVYGSYLILGSTFLLQRLLIGATRRPILTCGALLIVVYGTLISYSRGSWGGTILSMGLMTASTYLTAEKRSTRRRIILVAGLAVGLVILALLAILAHQDTRDFFLQRATLAQDYDEGVTGRFGNQLRSIPMLLDRPEGFGPLRFRLIFGQEPHNSYVGAFANDGWLGGLTWILIVTTTTFVGFRLMFAPSPYRSLAQIFFPPLFALLLQGFQIDIDHWRQVYLCFGAVWGIEAARKRWQTREQMTHARLKTGPDKPDS